jgi:two-component system, cell cycle sensor histidine kinase and response regulator CckA
MTVYRMPDLALFATIHIGVSIALALLLLMVYRRLHQATYLLYWAMFWMAIALNLAAGVVTRELLPGASRPVWLGWFAGGLIPFYPVLMVCAGLSLNGERSHRAIRWLLWSASGAFAALLAFFFVAPSAASSRFLIDVRPVTTSFAVAFFAWKLTRQEAGKTSSMRGALVAVTAIYALHNFALGSRLLGIHLYSTEFSRGYSPLAATVGILLQFCMTLVLAHGAIERARQASLDAEESDRRLRLTNFTVENSPLGIFWWTSDGRFKRLNRMAALMTGYGNEELLRMGPSDLDPAVAATEGANPWLKRNGSERHTFESRLRHKAGHRYPVEIANSFLEFEGVEYTVSFVRDITERYEAERHKAQLEMQVIQAQKMEALGRLTGGIAHDFNNSLTVILGYSSLLAPSNNLSPEEREAVQSIADAGAHSKHLVGQLLTFSRQQIIAPQPLNLNQTIMASQPMLARLIGEDIESQFFPGENLWDVLLDSTQVNQVLMNLVANARDAMPNGGKLKLETSNVRVDAAHAGEHREARAGKYVLLAVSDTGTGMDAETSLRVFEPFFTTKETGKGTGLGMATVYGIVRQNGGFIEVRSQPERGTMFKIYFPRFAEAGREYPAPALVKQRRGAAKGEILLVEDDELVRNITAAALDFLGYTPVVAANAREAIETCANLARPIDLVISDVVMPDMKGPELRDRLAELRPGLKVLFMSGYTSDVIVRHGVLQPGVHFIQKPFSFDNLGAKIKEILFERG